MKGYEHSVRKYQKTEKYKFIKRMESRALRKLKQRHHKEYLKIYYTLKKKHKKELEK